MAEKPKARIAPWKKKTVDELKKLISEHKTMLVASIKNLPGSQFQEISKKLRGTAIVKVPKKNLIFRAMDESNGEELKQLKDKVDSDFAVLFSNSDSFDLASDLLKNKSPAKAKPGQEAPIDIVIPAGPTDLVPGPAVSELGALGIQIQIKDGKIEIKEDKVIVKEGEEISQGASDLMSKLDIKPFSIGFIPLSAFDIAEKKLYTEIDIDPEGTLGELKSAFGKALPFAVEIGYPTSDTIGFLLSKAQNYATALDNLSPAEEEKSEEPSSEEAKEESSEEAPAEDEIAPKDVPQESLEEDSTEDKDEKSAKESTETKEEGEKK